MHNMRISSTMSKSYLSQDIEYSVGLTKIIASQSACKKISSILKLTHTTQQILGSHELNGHTHF